MRYVIGLTGGIACGKSNISRALRAEGAFIADADEISHELTASGGKALPLIREAFGDSVFRGEELDRRALADTVFSDSEKRNKLNAILHPMIFSELRERLELHDGVSVLEAPLLYECGLENECDEVWCAYIPQEEQVKRVMKRDSVSHAQALARIRSQMPALEKARRADRVIRTSGTKEESARQVLGLWRETLKRVEE